jgi:Type II secretion system (T2SS), protein E, N-terminal domain
MTANDTPKQLGQMLVERGLLSEEQLASALREHRAMPKALGRTMIDLGYITERDLVSTLAEQVGLEYVDLSEQEIDPAAAKLLPGQLARRYRAIPIGERNGTLLVAMSDPANLYALDDIRAVTNREVQPVVATASDVEKAIEEFAASLIGDLLAVSQSGVSVGAGTEQGVGTESTVGTEAVGGTADVGTEPDGAHPDLDEHMAVLREVLQTQSVNNGGTESHLGPGLPFGASIDRLVTVTWVLAAGMMGLIFATFVLIVITAIK